MFPEYYGLEFWGPNMQPTPTDGIVVLILMVVLLTMFGYDLITGYLKDRAKRNNQDEPDFQDEKTQD